MVDLEQVPEVLHTRIVEIQIDWEKMGDLWLVRQFCTEAVDWDLFGVIVLLHDFPNGEDRLLVEVQIRRIEMVQGIGILWILIGGSEVDAYD